MNQTAGLEHEFYFEEGELYHVDLASPSPWSNSMQFIVCGKVKRILHFEKQAILRAVAGWQSFDIG